MDEQLDQPTLTIPPATTPVVKTEMPTQQYSEEDIATLTAMWEQNATAREIATVMGRSMNNVRNKIANLQRKGVLKTKDPRNQLPNGFIEQTAGTYGLPIDVVAHLSSLFGNGAQRIMAGTEASCEAWVAQGGECYYLRGRVWLTCDTAPSGAVPMYSADGDVILVCRAVASMRKAMSHTAFVAMCQHIAKQFGL